MALVVRKGNALRLAAVCPAAAKLGLAPGMALADARARHPDLATLPHNPAADARELDRLAAHMLRLTPLVVPDPPDGLILEITGCAHLFGGEAGLLAAAIADCGFTVRHALTSHAPAARALVRFGHGGQDVRALPMAALELPEEALAGLNRAGLRTIGDIAARPAAGIAARFGPEAVVALRRLLGEERAPINPLPQRAPLRFERRFAEPVTHQAAIASHFHALLRQAARALEARGLGGKRFCLTLLRSDGARHRLDIDTSLPTRDPALVLRLFDERIEALADPLDPGFGYDSMTLSLSVTGPLGVIQAALDGEDEDQVALGELIDRLRTRLGPESLRHLVPRDSHIPERSQKTRPAALGSPLPRWPGPLADKPPRPLLLFDPPQPIDVIAQVPDAPPHRFRWRGKLHEICFAEGPERIAPEWWQSPEGHLPGGGVPTRDYYRVENSAGRRFWIFRHGLYAERVNPAWYIHGLFA